MSEGGVEEMLGGRSTVRGEGLGGGGRTWRRAMGQRFPAGTRSHDLGGKGRTKMEDGSGWGWEGGEGPGDIGDNLFLFFFALICFCLR